MEGLPDMKGKVALVTGASRGIGRATARLLAAEGAAVAVNWFRSESAANGVVAEIMEAGGQAMAVRADVRDGAQVRSMVAEFENSLGPLGLLVSNAAVREHHRHLEHPFTSPVTGVHRPLHCEVGTQRLRPLAGRGGRPIRHSRQCCRSWPDADRRHGMAARGAEGDDGGHGPPEACRPPGRRGRRGACGGIRSQPFS